MTARPCPAALHRTTQASYHGGSHVGSGSHAGSYHGGAAYYDSSYHGSAGGEFWQGCSLPGPATHLRSALHA